MISSLSRAQKRLPALALRRSGVTVLEWLMLLTILCGFVAVLVAGARREDTVEAARSIRTELEEIERAMEVLAEKNDWEEGREVAMADLMPEVRGKFKRLHRTRADVFGNPYGLFRIGLLPGVPEQSFVYLDGKIDPGYWYPYSMQGDSRDAIYREFYSRATSK